jgi:hypothetical protein
MWHNAGAKSHPMPASSIRKSVSGSKKSTLCYEIIKILPGMLLPLKKMVLEMCCAGGTLRTTSRLQL